MIFLIESIVLCLIFTLTVPIYGLRNPLAMIDSYPPAIVTRACLLYTSDADDER